MATTVYVADPYNWVEIAIVRDADWNDALPQLLEDATPIDLTSLVFEIYIRPTYDHAILLKKLSSATGEIAFTDAAAGQAAIQVPRSEVITDLPVGEWDYFAVLSDPADAPDSYREPFRGKLFVYPGNITE